MHMMRRNKFVIANFFPARLPYCVSTLPVDGFGHQKMGWTCKNVDISCSVPLNHIWKKENKRITKWQIALKKKYTTNTIYLYKLHFHIKVNTYIKSVYIIYVHAFQKEDDFASVFVIL